MADMPMTRYQRLTAQREKREAARAKQLALTQSSAQSPAQPALKFSKPPSIPGPQRLGSGAPFLSSSPVQSFGESMDPFQLNDDDLYKSILERLQNGS